MRIDSGALEFFYSIPDDVLCRIAMTEWETLESLCLALTLDLYALESKKGLAS